MEMAEGFLLGDDGDVVLAGVADEFGDVGRRHGAAERRGHGVVGVEERVFEVGRIEVGLVRGEDADLVLLEFEGGDGAAGEIVLNAAIFHGRPVADGARGQNGALRRGGQATA